MLVKLLDPSKTTVTFNNGVLTIIAPKLTQGETVRKIKLFISKKFEKYKLLGLTTFVD